MTPAKKMAQRLEAETLMCSGVMFRRIPLQDDLDAAVIIRRLAAALTEFHAAYKAGGWATNGIEQRHAEALRDIREEP